MMYWIEEEGRRGREGEEMIKIPKTPYVSDITLNSPYHIAYNTYFISNSQALNHFIHSTYLPLFYLLKE